MCMICTIYWMNIGSNSREKDFYHITQPSPHCILNRAFAVRTNKETHRIGAIGNVYTFDKSRYKIVRNIVFDCDLSPGNRKHCIKRFLIRVRRLLKCFRLPPFRYEGGRRRLYTANTCKINFYAYLVLD